jgi:TatD DNase family protein
MVIDSHCHLADEKFAGDLDAVVARAREAGVTTALCILSADEADEVARAAVVRAAWPDVHFAAAIHPHRTAPFGDRAAAAAQTTRHAVAVTGAVAVGEIGLDYHYDFAPRAAQQAVFAAQVETAVDLGRPVVIHMREATADTVAILREAGQGRVRGVMHCFSGTEQDARLSLDLGFYLSFAGILTFPKAESLRAIAAFVPEDRLLVETDAPFLAPVPYRGRRNETAFVVETLRQLATVRARSVTAMAEIVSRNFHELFLSAGCVRQSST